MDSLPQQRLGQAFIGMNIAGNVRSHFGDLYNINQTTPNRPKSPPNPLSTVPFPPDPDFIDRSSILSDIDQKLAVATRVALVGPGGVGKSQLAIQWSYRKRVESPTTCIFWMHASNEARYEQSIRDTLDQLRVPGRNEPQANVFKLLRTWLHDARNGNWLIILDRADDTSFLFEPPTVPGQPEAHNQRDCFVERRFDYLPACSHGSLLITSRSRAAALRMVDQDSIINVGPMEKEHALVLLKNKLDESHDQEDVASLARELDYMPLAIVQAASYIRQRAPRCTVQQYLDKLAKNDKSKFGLLNRDEGDPRRDREAKNSIILTWEISFEHIRTTRSSAADLLCLMSFFNSQAIPATLLNNRFDTQTTHGAGNRRADVNDRESWSNSGTAVPSERSIRKLDTEDKEFKKDLKLLLDYSFISRTTKAGIFGMHRLMQIAIQRWLVADGSFEHRGLQFMRNLDSLFPTPDSDNQKECQLLFPHAMAAIHLRLVEEEASVRQASVLYRSGLYARKSGAYVDAERMAAKSLQIRQVMFGDGHAHTTKSKLSLALVFQDQGRFEEAEALQLQVLDWRKQLLGGEHTVTMTSNSQLAELYLKQGRYEDAEGVILKVLEWTRQGLGKRWQREKAEELWLAISESNKRMNGFDDQRPSAKKSLSDPAHARRDLEQEGVTLDGTVQATRLSSTVLSDNRPDRNDYRAQAAEWTETHEKSTHTDPLSSDDEGISDIASICTDGQKHDLPRNVDLKLANAFADHIVENLATDKLKELINEEDILVGIQDLVRDFSILLNIHATEDSVRKEAVTWVRHKRNLIVSRLASSVRAWRPSIDDQVTIEEKMALLHFGDTEPIEYEDPNPEQNLAEIDLEMDQLDDLDFLTGETPELRDVVVAKKFLLDSEELHWMIDRIRLFESHSHVGRTFSHVRSQIASSIHATSEHVALSLEWDVLKILLEQYGGDQLSATRLSNMLVYAGTAPMCYACTTSEYVRQVWPASGPKVIECLEDAIASVDRMSCLALHHSRLLINLDGATTNVRLEPTTKVDKSQARIQILEVAEICVWLAIACRAHTKESTISLGFPRFANQEGRLVITVENDPVIPNESPDGRCWFGMVNNPIIACGYPVPKREQRLQQKGLELSLGLMARLSHADWVTKFGSILLFKGTISALVPVIEVGMSIVWHFLVNSDQKPMTYRKACSSAIETPHLSLSDMEHRRHFVGMWTRNALIFAGSDDDAMYKLHPSFSKPVSYYTLTWAGLTINGGKYLTVGTTFNFGKKDLAPVLKSSETLAYERQIQDASNMTVLLYSSRDRRGWLLDGASALVHLARAWLVSQSAEHKSSETMEQLQYIRDGGGRDSAIEVLQANREVPIFEDTAVVQETTTPGDLVSEHANPSTDSGYVSLQQDQASVKKTGKRTTSLWTYKALVIELWRKLEAMKEKLDSLKQQAPEIRVRLPSSDPVLTGWDVNDFLLNRTPLHPRSIKLNAEGKSWNKFVKEISSVTLMAESFFEMILPQDGSQYCQGTRTLPVGRDLLAVPLSVLLLTAYRFLRWDEDLAHNHARITDRTFLTGFEKIAENCRCAEGVYCDVISVLKPKAKYGFNTTQSIFDRCPNAAVIIGMPKDVSLWRRRSQSSDMLTRTTPSEARQPAVLSSSSGSMPSRSEAYLDPNSSQYGLSEDETDSSSDRSFHSAHINF